MFLLFILKNIESMLLKCTLLMGNSATVHDNKRFVMSKTKHLWTSQSKVNTCTL